MKKMSNEAKVGWLVVGTAVLIVAFASLIGVENPFRRSYSFYVTYNFAGGVDVGSPVRVSGIKVGRVEKVEFFVPEKSHPISLKEPGSADSGPEADDKEFIPVRLKISVRKEATRGIKRDSRFYVNLAGIIGERYIEVTPGTVGAPALQNGDEVAGVDPPRIDQLLSQSFNLAGKITELIEKNKGDIGRSIELLYKLSANVNQTLEWVDRSKIFKTDLQKLVNNLIAITQSVRVMTDKVDTPEGEKTLKLLHELLFRLEPLDSEHIKEFLQKEGIRAHIF
jgi:phospholipid/cholesterol/gamma-HCH transport system substrate-binding protein